MFERSEGYLKNKDGTQLYCQKWLKKDAIGTILITHGQGEHCDAYIRLIKSFESERWNFIAWDLRGHGRSDGRRGYVKYFSEYTLDFNLVVDDVIATHGAQGPIVLFAHSMGGLIQELALLKKVRKNVRGQILSSPLFGLSVKVPAYKAQAATILHKYLPQLTLGNELNPEMLTRDQAVIDDFAKDPLRHQKISSGAFLGMQEGMEKLDQEAHMIDLPTLLMISDNDPVISSADAQKIFHKLGSEHKDLKVFPNATHELVNDIIREDVFAFMKEYLKQHWS